MFGVQLLYKLWTTHIFSILRKFLVEVKLAKDAFLATRGVWKDISLIYSFDWSETKLHYFIIWKALRRFPCWNSRRNINAFQYSLLFSLLSSVVIQTWDVKSSELTAEMQVESQLLSVLDPINKFSSVWNLRRLWTSMQ